jgi:hypothetical protein
MDKTLDRIALTVETRTGKGHRTGIRLAIPSHSSYTLLQDGKPVALELTGDWDCPWRASVALDGPSRRLELIRTDRPKP